MPVRTENAPRATGIGAVSALAAALAAGLLAVLPAVTPAGAAPDAAALYRQAVATTKAWSVHYTSTGVVSKVSSSESGDAGPAGGTQQVLVRSGTRTDSASLIVIGEITYIRANAMGLEDLMGFSPTPAVDDSGRWILFSTANTEFSQVVAGIRSRDVAHEITLKGPLTLGKPRQLDGYQVDAIHGTLEGDGAKPMRTILYVRASGPPLPVEEDTVGAQGKPNGEDHIVFSRWGERIRPRAPDATITLGPVSAT